MGDRLDAALDEKARVLVGELADGFRALGTIGHARGVAQVEDVFRGQQLLHGAHDREATDAGVEKSKGCGIHGRDSVRRGNARKPQVYGLDSSPRGGKARGQ